MSDQAETTAPQVVIAKSFFLSANTLSGQDRGRVLSFVAKFMENPANPGVSFERIDGAKDPDLWSGRITQALRAIIHRGFNAMTLLYAGQHDEAYDWAGRRRVERNARTGAIHVIEVVEEIRKIVDEIRVSPEVPPLLSEATFTDDYLLSLGIPEDWLPAIRNIRSDEQVLAVATRLPEEVGEYLLEIASGNLVTPPAPPEVVTIGAAEGAETAPSITDVPDNLRRFTVVSSLKEVSDLLEQPLEAWTRFLHPAQRAIVAKDWNGPVKVTGSAGTGKTVVAMHRARHLARQGKRVLLASFVTTLCKNIERSLRILCTEEERRLITVRSVHSLALELARKVRPAVKPVDDKAVEGLIETATRFSRVDRSPAFLAAEWKNVVEAQGIRSWPEYREASRLGRGTPLSVRDRKSIWQVFERVIDDLDDADQMTFTQLCQSAREGMESSKIENPFDAVVVDEVQDLRASEILFLSELASSAPGDFMLVGDAGQRIYPGGFSLRSLGIETRGRSRILRINYRTTDQIRRCADRVLGSTADDLDGASEDRATLSLLSGPPPHLEAFRTTPLQIDFVVSQINRLIESGLQPGEIAVFARSGPALKPFREALEAAEIPVHLLSQSDDLDSSNGVNCGTMHRAKGLEFKVVFVVEASAEIIPHRGVVSRIDDPADRDAALAQERRLLYVSMTRARDQLFVTWIGKPSPYLEGLEASA